MEYKIFIRNILNFIQVYSESQTIYSITKFLRINIAVNNIILIDLVFEVIYLTKKLFIQMSIIRCQHFQKNPLMNDSKFVLKYADSHLINQNRYFHWVIHMKNLCI